MAQALKFETFNLHLDKFDFTLNNKKNEIISAGDDLVVKVFDLHTKTMRDCIDVNDEIKAISFGCGKLVYGQSNSLQMIDLNINSKFNEEAAILLTKFNSNVRRITFNEKLNLLISFSEDDDLHVINLTTLDVLKYKSNHEGSLKSMIVSPSGDFLITTGCDGYLSIYDFLKNDDVGKIISRKKISISSKLSMENVQALDVDINTLNQCVIGGNVILRTMTLESAFSYDYINVIPEDSIAHKNDINYVRWINNGFLVTCDVINVFKIWNFSTKNCIYQLDAVNITASNSDNMIKRIEISKISNDNICSLIFIDKYGNLNISEKINYSVKANENLNGNKFKDVKYKLKNNDDIEIDKKIVNMISDLDFDEDSKNLENVLNDFEDNKNKNNSEDLLNLSDVEDENGEIKNSDDIKKAREEKKKENVVESFADDIIGCLPQQIFTSSSTNVQDNSNSRYLCWNMIGQIIQRQETSFKAIDIIFADISNKKKITYIDANDLSLAAMNNCGAFLANKIDDENEDEYQREDTKQTAVLQFKTIQTNLYSMFKDWTVSLPAKEGPLCLTMGTDWCAVFTTSFYLRVFSLFGNQKFILSLPQVVTMAGHENYLAYVYHSSVPLLSNQNLRLKILDSNQMFNEVYDGILPLSPESTLTWFIYSEDGFLVTCDSKSIIRGFFFGVCNNWIPILDLEMAYHNIPNTHFWPIGVQDEEIYGVEMKSYMNEPAVNAKLPVKVHPIKIPFIQSTGINSNTNENTEDKILRSNLFIKHDQIRCENYKTIKQYRDIKSPEYYYCDNLKDEQDLNNKKKEHDKMVISHMKDCIVLGTPDRVIDLFNSLMMAKSREIAIKLCFQLDQHSIGQILTKKSEMMNIQTVNYKGKSNQNSDHYNGNKMTNGNFNGDSSVNDIESQLKNNHNGIFNSNKNNNLSSFAINVDNFRTIEEEVRNEMAFIEDKSSFQNEDNNTMNFKASLNLDRKSSNPFFKTLDTNSKQNLNLYDDLSKSYSGLINQPANNQQSAQTVKPSVDLSFQNVKQKIGFKRKNNELITTNKPSSNDANISQVDKKFKKN